MNRCLEVKHSRWIIFKAEMRALCIGGLERNDKVAEVTRRYSSRDQDNVF